MITYLNISINRAIREPHKKKRIEHKNIKASFFGMRWFRKGMCEEVQMYIKTYWPGWSLTGYALDREIKNTDSTP